MAITDKFIGKSVAVRGIGSGINVGRCAGMEGTAILFEAGSFFCPSWEYSDKSHGAFHSLANGDVTGGSITLIEKETIITDVAQVVECNDSVIPTLSKFAKP